MTATKDGKGAGDHDQPFAFGNSRSSVAMMGIWARIHLTNLRSDVRDYRAGKMGGAADGDLDHVELKDGKLWIPPAP